jgi:biopolymer transport protein ExbD
MTMANISTPSITEAKANRNRLPSQLHIDMTPLVDLSFLLISFFIFTTTLSQPTTTNLVMPKASKDPLPLRESRALSMLLGKENTIFVYKGRWEDALAQHAIVRTTFNEYQGLGKMIREKQKELGSDREELMLLLKPTRQATYKNLIDALDETNINLVKKYAVVAPTEAEVNYVGSAIAGEFKMQNAK